MCYICESSPHLASCPFHKIKSNIKCNACGGVIYEGEIAYKLKNELFHSDCLRELSGMDVIETLEIKPQ